MQLKEVLAGIDCRFIGAPPDLVIGGVTCDSRTVKPGDLFVAVPGCSLDGTRFITDARARGAVAVVAEDGAELPAGVPLLLVPGIRAALPVIADTFFGRPSLALKVVGITGTNGKTTITYLLENIVKRSGSAAGVIGTINYRLKDKIIPAKNTTPGPLELQALLAEMVAAGIGYAVMEVSSHSLDQRRVERVRYDVGIFTNITSDHLDYHKTVDDYFAAKTKLFGLLKDGGVAVLNSDDRKVASLAASLKCRRMTYGIRNAAEVRAERIRFSFDGSDFLVAAPDGVSYEVRTGLIGMHNVSNILAAAAAATALGIAPDAIRQGIEDTDAVPGRLEPVDAGQAFKVVVDYAHTEDALRNVLGLLREIATQRIIVVFGCGGNRDRTKRPLMGRAVCELADYAVITSDNPRFEDPAAIIGEIEAGVAGTFANYETIVDRRAAIEKAIGLAREGDIVLIAGKGHEDYQIVQGATLPFDDRKVAYEILGSERVVG